MFRYFRIGFLASLPIWGVAHPSLLNAQSSISAHEAIQNSAIVESTFISGSVQRAKTSEIDELAADEVRHLPDLRKEASRLLWLNNLRNTLEQRRGKKIAHIFDAHGDPDIFDHVLTLVREGKIQQVIFHGDAFDRGDRNFEVLQALQQLHELLGDDLIVLIGNHELWLIQAMLFDDLDAMAEWIRHSDAFFKEAGLGSLSIKYSRIHDETAKRDFLLENMNDWRSDSIRNAARWMASHARLHFVDDYGWLHVHAGIPLNSKGRPWIRLSELREADRKWLSIQEETLRSGRDLSEHHEGFKELLKKFGPIFWIASKSWVKPLAADPYLLQTFLEKMGNIFGVMFGHNHLSELLNVAGRLVCGDLGQSAFMIQDEKGLTLITRKRDYPNTMTERLVISTEEMIRDLDERIALAHVPVSRKGHGKGDPATSA